MALLGSPAHDGVADVLDSLGYALHEAPSPALVDMIVAAGAIDPEAIAAFQRLNPLGVPALAVLDGEPAPDDTRLRGFDLIAAANAFDSFALPALSPAVLVDERVGDVEPGSSQAQALWRTALARATANCDRAIGEYRAGIDAITPDTDVDAPRFEVEQLRRALAARAAASAESQRRVELALAELAQVTTDRDQLTRSLAEERTTIGHLRGQLAHERQAREQAIFELTSERQRLAVRIANAAARVPGVRPALALVRRVPGVASREAPRR